MADDGIIYLDNNATTPLDPAVLEEMLTFLTRYYGNPSSGYVFASKPRKAVDLARQRLADLIGCEPSEIVFASGGTESNNAVIHSALQFEPSGKHVVISAVDYCCNTASLIQQQWLWSGCIGTSLRRPSPGEVNRDEVEVDCGRFHLHRRQC
jgi:Cysteine sulfinate desulfinase/cysteine desulfurase and related enzymes